MQTLSKERRRARRFQTLGYGVVEFSASDALSRGTDPSGIASGVHREPTVRFARRARILYDGLRIEQLDLPDLARGASIPVLDV